MNLLPRVKATMLMTKPRFWGKDVLRFYGIQVTNLLLTILTFGLYYPWARAASLHYIYQETELEGSRFIFHGTGKEMFRGFIKVFLAFLGLIILFYFLLDGFVQETFGGLFDDLQIKIYHIIYAIYGAGFVFSLLITPLVIHGSMKYRLSRTSWRGIHLGYRGSLGEIYKVYFIGLLLTVITLGIYYPWLIVSLRKYVIGNMRMGNVRFAYEGTGGDYFIIQLLGTFGMMFSFGIYYFWYKRDVYNFLIDNIVAYQNEKKCYFQSKMNPPAVFEWVIVNNIVVSMTLGLAIPWAALRSYQFFINYIEIYGDFNADGIHQTEEEYKNAISDDLSTMLDVGIV
jgi:uncharacterized membrane protein YjgN (DUF898 family)